ncbi:MAG: hypothetical protein K2P57_09680, partial [Burkholderiales bacterium]|nr:hypothetical protein [Burkholderiales bacterium]
RQQFPKAGRGGRHAQSKKIDAWWIGGTAFVVLFVTLLLLVFIGEALRDAFDTRKSGSRR